MSRVERDTEPRVPGVGDLDPVLLVGSACSVRLAQVVVEHDIPAGAKRCPSCGWVLAGGQRVCPSRALARAVADQRPVPGWLAHLVDVVPGAIAARRRPSLEELAELEDGLPGLFDAPARIAPAAPSRTRGGRS